MSKAILEMEMPQKCCECPCCTPDELCGAVWYKNGYENGKWLNVSSYTKNRHPNCPLKPLEKHPFKSAEYETFVIQSGIFGTGSEKEKALIDEMFGGKKYHVAMIWPGEAHVIVYKETEE